MSGWVMSNTALTPQLNAFNEYTDKKVTSQFITDYLINDITRVMTQWDTRVHEWMSNAVLRNELRECPSVLH